MFPISSLPRSLVADLRLGLTAAPNGLTPESAIIATGTVVAAPAVKLGGLEVLVETAEIWGRADNHLPIVHESGLDKWIDHRQVSLRYPEQQLVFSVRWNGRGPRSHPHEVARGCEH